MQRQKKFEIPPDNPKKVAMIWADFVNIEKRMKKEIPFILEHSPVKDPRVLDAALGCGATTVGLRLSGVSNVLSNEIEEEFIYAALYQGQKYNIGIDITIHDWTDKYLFLVGKFDIITCLGNSLTCIFDAEKRLESLSNFMKILNPNGVLIIDERNYPRILEGRFSHSGEYVYCGTDKVVCSPVLISRERVVMEYAHLGKNVKVYIEMYPFKKGEMRRLLKKAGFGNIRVYGDYKSEFNYDDVEFFTYVASR